MSETTKLQQYKYSLRTMTIAPKNVPNGYMCNNIYYVYPVPPDNAITIENLYLHLIVQFNASVASGDRVIRKIGIANERPSFGGVPNRLRAYDVNLSADPTTRKIDTRIDLSALLKKDNVRWRDFYNNPATTDQTYVYIETPFGGGGFDTMQDRCLVYYNGNTIARNVSKQSQRKRIEQVHEIAPQMVRIPYFSKVFATNKCIWCNNYFEQFQITCQYCHNCQYCGMVAFSHNECQNCGNHTDDEIKREFEKRKTVIF